MVTQRLYNNLMGSKRGLITSVVIVPAIVELTSCINKSHWTVIQAYYIQVAVSVNYIPLDISGGTTGVPINVWMCTNHYIIHRKRKIR